MSASPAEFAFELDLCRTLEARRDAVVSRQLGGGAAAPGGRILDVVLVEPGPAFDERRAITSETIPAAALESDVGPGRGRYWKDAFDCHPERARRAVDRACEIGFFERERRGGREYVRQATRYPDWVDGIVGVENKPDLGRPGDLEWQLRVDVSLALVDRAVLATESHVTGAHLNRIPDAVGVWRFDRDAGAVEVVREPQPLPVDDWGLEPRERHPGRTDVAVVSPAAKARARRRLVERAYGKGWRTYGFPGCIECSADRDALPYCEWKKRIVDAEAECGDACPAFEPAPEPDVDLEDERDAKTPWDADPAGRTRRQSGLDRYG